MSLPYIEDKIEMIYDSSSPDIEDLLYEKTRFEHECQNNNFNILYVVRELVSTRDNFELMQRMHNRLRNGKSLLWNCLKLACVVEYISTNSVVKEEVDRELLIGKLWPKYTDMYDAFYYKYYTLLIANENGPNEEQPKLDFVAEGADFFE